MNNEDRDRPREAEGLASVARQTLTLQQAIDLAVQNHNAGNLVKAEGIYQQILQAEPNQPVALHLLGVIAHQVGNDDIAVDLISRALAINPDDAEAYSNLGNALTELGKLDDAVASLQKAIARKPNFSEAHNNLGNAFTGQDNLDDAVRCYQKAVGLNPDFAEAHSNLGNVLTKQGRLEEAVAVLQKAISIRSDFPGAHYNLGKARSGQGDLEAAVACYQEAIFYKPDYAEAHFDLGNTRRDQGNLVDAVACYQKAISFGPQIPQAYNNLGNALRDQGNLADAVACYQKTISLKPDYAEAHNNLGIALTDQGNLEEAVARYQNTLSVKPDDAKALCNLGNVLTEQGNLEEAVAVLQKAISLQPDYAEAFNNLWFALRPLCHGLVADSQKRPLVERIIGSLPTPPEPDIMRLQYRFLFGEDGQQEWQSVIDNLPDLQKETIGNTQKTPSPSADQPEKVPASGMAALLHFGRSGSGYLHSLLDGHPNVSTLPGVYMCGYFGREVWNSLSGGGFQELPERFSQLYKVLFDARCPDKVPPAFINDPYTSNSVGVAEGFTRMGTNRDTPLTLERGRFLENLGGILNDVTDINHGQFFEAVHHAYEKTLGNRFSDKKLLFYHLHKNDPYGMANFLGCFPKAKLLMIIRNPVKSCESWVLKEADMEKRNAYKFYYQIINRINLMMTDLNCPAFQTQDSAAICLEDIKENPKEAMRRLCLFLGIEDAPSLYESTMQGLKWWGDPSSKLFGRTHDTESWGDDPIEDTVGAFFSAMDQLILETLFYPLSARFGYAEQNDRQFKNALKKVRPLLDQPMDFEMKLAESFPRGYPDLEKSAPFKSFHAVLMGAWRKLDEFGTYPYLLKSLPQY